MRPSREIVLLQDLLRLALRSARLGAALREIEVDLYWRGLAEQMEDGDRELTIELSRYLLSRGADGEALRTVMTEPALLEGLGAEVWVLRGDLETTACELHAAIRNLLRDPTTSRPLQELLGVHFLRLELRLADLQTAIDMPAMDPMGPASRLPG